MATWKQPKQKLGGFWWNTDFLLPADICPTLHTHLNLCEKAQYTLKSSNLKLCKNFFCASKPTDQGENELKKIPDGDI